MNLTKKRKKARQIPEGFKKYLTEKGKEKTGFQVPCECYGMFNITQKQSFLLLREKYISKTLNIRVLLNASSNSPSKKIMRNVLLHEKINFC